MAKKKKCCHSKWWNLLWFGVGVLVGWYALYGYIKWWDIIVYIVTGKV